MAAAPRYDIMQDAGFGLPKNFEDIKSMCKGVHQKVSGVSAMVCENHHR